MRACLNSTAVIGEGGGLGIGIVSFHIVWRPLLEPVDELAPVSTLRL